MFLLTRPSMRDIDAFMVESRALPLSYEQIGIAREPEPPPGDGWKLDEASGVIGSGEAAFAGAKRALMDWKQFDLGWTEVYPKAASIEAGSVVAVLVRHVGFWSLNGCRVVYRIGDANEFGFAYGTLANHAETGEEIFAVQYDPAAGAVSYRIRSVSRPRALLARMGYPLARLLQARFRAGSVRAMRRAIQS